MTLEVMEPSASLHFGICVICGLTWRIQQRYVNTGLDENIGARLWNNGSPVSLALITDRQAGFIMGVQANGAEQVNTGFYLRNPFGKIATASTLAAGMDTHAGVGYAGAGTPTSAAGGYVYLRNRWYDPQTGRFLSQDPIGLAGGVNLYAYAGNNPVTFTDPFGLYPDGDCCKALKGAAIGATIGAGTGLVLATACASSTVGICTIAAPALVTGFSGLGASLGGLVGTILEAVGNSPDDAPGRTAGGRATDEHGNVLGPSGKPAVHEVRHSTRKAAKDAARNEGQSAPVSHPSPAVGEPHFHPAGPDGEKVPNSTHHTYPE